MLCSLCLLCTYLDLIICITASVWPTMMPAFKSFVVLHWQPISSLGLGLQLPGVDNNIAYMCSMWKNVQLMPCVIIKTLTEEQELWRENRETDQFTELYLSFAQIRIHSFATWCNLQCCNDLHLDVIVVADLILKCCTQRLQQHHQNAVTASTDSTHQLSITPRANKCYVHHRSIPCFNIQTLPWTTY